jgi:hypothetical protein
VGGELKKNRKYKSLDPRNVRERFFVLRSLEHIHIYAYSHDLHHTKLNVPSLNVSFFMFNFNFLKLCVLGGVVLVLSM